MRGKLHTLYSASARKTQKIAQKLAQKIIKSKFRQKNALIIGLQGELGSGKTTFIQGFAKEFGVKRHITSPTFLIIRSYKLKAKSYKLLYHIDTYRIEKIKELNNLDFKKIIADPTNVVLIEWAEKIKRSLPKNTLWIKFEHGQKENERTIIL